MSEETQKQLDAASQKRAELEDAVDAFMGNHPRDIEMLDEEAKAAEREIEKRKQELADAKEWANDVLQRSRLLRTARTPQAIAQMKDALAAAASEERRLQEIHAWDESRPFEEQEAEAPKPEPLPPPPTLAEWKVAHQSRRLEQPTRKPETDR